MKNISKALLVALALGFGLVSFGAIAKDNKKPVLKYQAEQSQIVGSPEWWQEIGD